MEIQYGHLFDVCCDTVDSRGRRLPFDVEIVEAHRIQSVRCFLLPVDVVVSFCHEFRYSVPSDVSIFFYLPFYIVQGISSDGLFNVI